LDFFRAFQNLNPRYIIIQLSSLVLVFFCVLFFCYICIVVVCCHPCHSFLPCYLLSPLLFVIAFIIPLQLCCLSSPCFLSPFLVVIITFVGHYHHWCLFLLLFIVTLGPCHCPIACFCHFGLSPSLLFIIG
jgi:hypothetical protein